MKKFVILTRQRTGSTFFRLWLNNHPSIRCHGEIFLRYYDAKDGFKYYCNKGKYKSLIYRFINHKVFSRMSFNYFLLNSFLKSFYYNPSHSGPWIDMEHWDDFNPQEHRVTDKAVGFKLMFNQLNYYRHLKKFIEKKELSIICLTRKNILRLFLSEQTRKKRNFAHSITNIKPLKIIVSPNTIINDLERLTVEQKKIISCFSNNPKLEITYENFFYNNNESKKKIMNFLNVKNLKFPFPKQKKLNSNHVGEIIYNYEEICNILEKTRFSEYLK